MKKILLFTFILILIALTIFFVVNRGNKVHAPHEDIKENKVDENVSFEYDETNISESTEEYAIDFSYPLLKDSYVNAKIDSFVKDSIEQFKNEIEDFGPLPVLGRKYTLLVNFEYKESEDYKTFVFLTSIDMGGAHPNHFFDTFTFDNKGNHLDITTFLEKEFALENVFSIISSLAQAKLREDLGEEISASSWIEEGASSNPINFQDFYIEDDSIHFLFEPYSVAAYAYSSREVKINFSEIKN